MATIKLNKKTGRITLTKSTTNIKLTQIGRPGRQGDAGKGVPTGGLTNQALTKSSDADFDTEWSDVPSTAYVDAGDAQALAGAKDYADVEVEQLNSELAAVAKTGSYDDLSDKPAIPVLPSNIVESVQAGTNVTVDNTDPKNPIVSATGGSTVSFDDVTDKPLAPAYTGLLVNNNSFDSFPSDTASYSLLKEPDTFAVRKSDGTLQVEPGVDTYDAVVFGQLTMVEDELYQDLQDGDAATLASANLYTDTKVSGITREDIGLGNVDNTSDLNKPISTATQTALNAKVNKAGDTMTGPLAITAGDSSIPFRVSASPSVTYVDAYFENTGDNAAQSNYIFNIKNASGIMRRGGQMTSTLFNRTNLAENSGMIFSTLTGGVQSATLELIGNEARVPAGKWFAIGNNGPRVMAGTGFPNGVVSAPVGSKYTDKNATNGAIEWVKRSGTGNTGWEVSVGDTGWRAVGSLLINGATANVFSIRRYNSNVLFWTQNLVTSSGTAIISAIPQGFRPIENFARQFYGFSSGGKIGTAIFHPTSGIKVVEYSSAIYGSDNYISTDPWPTTLPGTAV